MCRYYSPYCCCSALCDFEIEHKFSTQKYLSKLEAQVEREKERLRVAQELEKRRAARVAKYEEILAAEAAERAKKDAEREAELLKVAKIRQEIRDLRKRRRAIETETAILALKADKDFSSCLCYKPCLYTTWSPCICSSSFCTSLPCGLYSCCC
mmetsp:Transcript_38632/g.76028  ORF Transcript_38632/g.76028 Transcript_38632/m.76028 type:complete len:154 (+) Transcript_38632:35-496(+)